jgi:hypothetical protein
MEGWFLGGAPAAGPRRSSQASSCSGGGVRTRKRARFALPLGSQRSHMQQPATNRGEELNPQIRRRRASSPVPLALSFHPPRREE